MTVEIYKILLTYMQCPRCHVRYTEDDFTMWGDHNGYELEDTGFNYILLGSCKFCKLITSFKQLGILQLNNMAEVESFMRRLSGGTDALLKLCDKAGNGGGS